MSRSVMLWGLLLLLAGPSSGQLFGGLDNCTSREFLRDVSLCFADKFLSLIPSKVMRFEQENGQLVAEDEAAYYAGRRLQAFGDNTNKDAVIRENVLKSVGDGFISKHGQLMNNLGDAVKVLQQHEKAAVLMERLAQADLPELVNTWMQELWTELAPLALAVVPSAAAGGATPFVDIPPALCLVLGSRFCECMANYHEEDFEDNLKWVRCFYDCDDLIQIGQCVDTRFQECDSSGRWSFASNIVNKGFAAWTELDSDCLLHVRVPHHGFFPRPENPILLEEGGVHKNIEVHTYMSPGALCADLSALSGGIINIVRDAISTLRGRKPSCEVNIEVTTSNYLHQLVPDMKVDGLGVHIETGRAKCRTGKAISQVRIGPHRHASEDGTGKVRLNSTNWVDTHVIPLRAAVDHMRDGDLITHLTIKLKIRRRHIYNFKYNISVTDKEPMSASVCSSLGDPHLTTFDGHYYNNHFEGYFQLYKHDTKPYQVQAIYQRCADGVNGTCTCAVAVQSGDDVFVADACRRRGCEGDDCHALTTHLYLNGQLTKGTRIYRHPHGQAFDVVLPHGLYVRLAQDQGRLNVWLTPSPYDKSKSKGLCGVFDENPDNDLTLPSGLLYRGPGTEPRGNPRAFFNQWRVSAEEQIFGGMAAAEQPGEDLHYCDCFHVLLMGVQCHCGGIADMCNFHLGEEVTANVSMVARKPRDADTDIDVDADFDPADFDWSHSSWNESDAVEACRDLLLSSENLVLSECLKTRGEDFFQTIAWQCQEDILITDGEDWRFSALEAAKTKCLAAEALERDVLELRTVDMGNIIDRVREHFAPVYENDTCLNECYDQGVCVRGVCECEEGGGGDCGDRGSPAVLLPRPGVSCDPRFEDCAWATFLGVSLPTEDLTCHVQPMMLMPDGSFRPSGSSSEVPAFQVTPNQAVCQLPQETSYLLSLQLRGKELPVSRAGARAAAAASNSQLFMAADAACYHCDESQQTCVLRESDDFCMVKGVCSVADEGKFNDTCLFCNTTEHTREWSWRDTEACAERRAEEDDGRRTEKKSRDIRIAVACSLSAFIVFATVVLFFLSKKNVDDKQEMELTSNIEDGVKAKTTDVITSHPEEAQVYDNAVSVADEASPRQHGDDVFQHSDALDAELVRARQQARSHSRTRCDSEGSQSVKDLMRVKKLARDSRRDRTESVGSTSVASIGIGGGGGGAASLHRYNPSLHEESGMGGRGSPLPKTQYDGLHINTFF